MRGAIPDREDVRQAGPPLRIDRHAIVARCPGGDQRCDGRYDADPDDRHLRRQDRSIGKANAGHFAVPSIQFTPSFSRTVTPCARCSAS